MRKFVTKPRNLAPIRTPHEQQKMRNACQFNASLMDLLRTHVKEGITTAKLDAIASEYTQDHGHIAACLNYPGPLGIPFPKSLCTSVNDVVCHGIPDNKPLQDGDIVNVDITTIVDGWYGDQSETFLIGNVSPAARKLTQVTFDCLYNAIGNIGPQSVVSDIGHAIVSHAHANKCTVVEDYQGHGIGEKFHQHPNVPHYPTFQTDSTLLPAGICFTIEPMINLGRKFTTPVDPEDGWTVRTADSKLTAQFEHTILMTETGPEILTLTKNGPQEGHQF